VWHVSESGLYALIFQSRKPNAKKFRKWVTSEVLPSLRNAGEYRIPGTTKVRDLENEIEIWKERYQQLSGHYMALSERAKTERAKTESTAKSDAPDVLADFTAKAGGNKYLLAVADCIREFIANELGGIGGAAWRYGKKIEAARELYHSDWHSLWVANGLR
jgi:hypothetical protein